MRQGIGLRVAQWRRLAELTQEELGRRAGYSKQYINAIENGRSPVNSRRLLSDLAHGLGVEVHHLTGQPYTPTSETDLLNYTIVPLVRTALDEPDEELQVRPAAELEHLAEIEEAKPFARSGQRLAHVPGLQAGRLEGHFHGRSLLHRRSLGHGRARARGRAA